jgi:hypothetical protein
MEIPDGPPRSKEEQMNHHAWVRFLTLVALLWPLCKPVSAETIDVTNATSVEVPSGAALDIVFAFPDLSLIGGTLPTDLFLNPLGPVPSEPFASYEFTSLLESLDGLTTITLPSLQGTASIACLDFLCTQQVPVIQLTLSYSDGPGLGVLPANGLAGQPGGELVLTNIGPPLELGGIFPGQTLGQGLSVSLGNSHGGEDVFASSVSFVPTPEPATLGLCLIGVSLFLFAVRHRLSTMKQRCSRRGIETATILINAPSRHYH